MENAKFKVIQGGLPSASRIRERQFSGAYATNTRLMGVFAVYVHWVRRAADKRYDSDLHQFFYIDAEEYGLESYRSVSDSNADELYETEQSVTGGLGGAKVELSEKEALFLVRKYAAMTKNNGAVLPAKRDEYGFMFEKPLEMTPIEENALFYKLCVPMETNEQLINYFLMRYFAKDKEAVRHLSEKPVSWRDAPNSRSETLCKNSIESYTNPNGVSFLCESLIENNNRYQLVLSEIYPFSRKVFSFHIRSSFFVSPSEAAMMLGRPEYITVYEIMGDLSEARRSVAKLYPGALQKAQDSGALFLQFKTNNDHLKESVYRLNDDIRGIFYITDYGQLVAVSYSLLTINRIEKELQIAIGSTIIPSAKYEFKESVFYEFVQGDFMEFSEFMEYLNEYHPQG